VLRNLAGLTDAGALAEREAQASSLRLAQLGELRLEGLYDLRHLQEFHRFIFQDIYPWAGELRSTPLAKPGSMFALPEHVEGYATNVFGQLAGERHLCGLRRDQFADRITHYYAEINAVHPFRDGNGRAQRAFLRQLALDAGHCLAWERLEQASLVYASQRSFQGDNLPMRDLIDLVLDPPDR
jgi:cell filamentation protein